MDAALGSKRWLDWGAARGRYAWGVRLHFRQGDSGILLLTETPNIPTQAKRLKPSAAPKA
ncbi:MAG: hypothetical protein ACI9D0_000822 [Bacteroidia bacterium]|jgi:hypothetical protein